MMAVSSLGRAVEIMNSARMDEQAGHEYVQAVIKYVC